MKNSTSKIIANIIIAVILWMIWRPLGAFIIVVQTGYLAQFIRTNENLLFWSIPVVIFIGIIWGFIISILIQAVIYFAIPWLSVQISFYIIGLMAVLYVGFGTKRVSAYLMDKGKVNLLTIQILGLITYVIVSAIALFIL
jgi:hypothetical protein